MSIPPVCKYFEPSIWAIYTNSGRYPPTYCFWASDAKRTKIGRNWTSRNFKNEWQQWDTIKWCMCKTLTVRYHYWYLFHMTHVAWSEKSKKNQKICLLSRDPWSMIRSERLKVRWTPFGKIQAFWSLASEAGILIFEKKKFFLTLVLRGLVTTRNKSCCGSNMSLDM